MNGAIGVHIEANSAGYSRDIAIANTRQIGGRFATIVNDPLLCLMMLDIGVTPIHRINRGGLLDDNQQQYGTTREYIRTAHTEVPDKRALLNWNNEPAHDPIRLLREGMVAIDEAVKLGRTLVMLGYSYGNPEPEVHDILDPLYRRMAETGMIYACHEGTDIQHPSLASCYPSLIGRFLPIQRKYGLQVIVTEFAASKDAWNGWQTWNSNYAKVCEDTVREVYAPHGVYMTPFTLFQWKTGFDYVNSPELKAAWAATNIRYPVKEQPPVTQPGWESHNWGTRIDGKAARMNTNINVRNIPSEIGSTIVGTLSDNTVILYWSAPYKSDTGGKYNWYKVLFNGQERYIAEVSGLRFETPPVPVEQRISYSAAEVNSMRAHINALLDLLNKGVPSDSGATF